MKHTILQSRLFCVLATVIALTFPNNLSAQNRTVTGTVKDDNGEPVIGAVVMLSGSTTNGAMTDGNGNFSLSIPEKSNDTKVTASCLGYKTETMEVGNGKVNFVLQNESTMLDETVVVGYGSMRRSDLTGSVTSVKIDENRALQSTSMDQLINGNAPGVQVMYSGGSPDAGVALRIRGTSSLNGSNEPLYVIDGVIASNPESATMLDERESEAVNNLMGINPQDIASIEILKDASATAIYGADGANGVILITTKQAEQDRPTVNFNAGFDISTVNKRIEVLRPNEYVNWLNDILAHGKDTYASQILEKYNEGKYNFCDWQDYAYRLAPRQRYYLKISGRPKGISYNFSVGFNNTQGIVKGTGSNNVTTSMSVRKTFWKQLDLRVKLNMSYLSTANQQSANSTTQNANTSFVTSILRYRPLDYKDAQTEEEEQALEEEYNDPENRSSPKNWIRDAFSNRIEFRVIPSVNLEYKPSKWLAVKSVFGADYRSGERSQWKGISVNRSADGALGVLNYSENFRWNWDNTVTANGKWGKHRLTGTAGMVLRSSGSKDERIYGENIKQYSAMIDNVNSSEKMAMSYAESMTNTVSFFTRAIYSYDNRYVLTATYRADGCSKFVDNNKFGHFPSFAFAWRLSEEPWFKVPVISSAKLRAGWGRVGNSNIPNYQTYVTYNAVNYGNHFTDAGYTKGSVVQSFANKALKWESADQVNVGLDLGMWSGRFTLTLDAYYKAIDDLLQRRDVPYSSGYINMWMNTGSIVNKGIEIAIQTVPIKTRFIEWSLDANISINRNRLQSFGFDTNRMTMFMPDKTQVEVNYTLGSSLGSSDYYLNTPGNIFIEGQPIGLFYGILTDGIVQEGETGPGLAAGEVCTPGMVKYVDLDGNGYINDNDRTIIGNANPDFTYGINTSLSFYNFTFSMQFQGEAGKQLLNTSKNMLMDNNNPRRMNIYRDAYYNAWTPENPNNEYIGLYDCFTNQHRYLVTDRYVEDASYLRLANIGLTYSFNLPKKSFVKGLDLGFNVQNAYVWTKYSGYDPNVNTFINDLTRVGVDSGAYPNARTFCFDLKLKF